MDALLIIDMQEAFIGSKRNSNLFQPTMDTINEAISVFRQLDKPIFIIRDLSEGSSSDFDTIPEVMVSSEDHEIIKYHNNSFWNTTLDDILKQKNIKSIIISGNAAEYCIIATYFGALERGYHVSLLENGIFAETAFGLEVLHATKPMISLSTIKNIL
jgi:nicotinamidase-related amidase